MSDRTWYDVVCNPRAVAIVGASTNRSARGGRIHRNLETYGYTGRVFLVNPNHAFVQGHRSYPSVKAIEDPIEMALVMVPSTAVLGALRECAASGVKVAFIGSSGYAESGSDGESIQREMLSIAHESGMRLIGPNCNGIISFRSRFTGTFMSTLLTVTPSKMKDDGIALVSQSGAVGAIIFGAAQRSGLGIGTLIATGNAVDIGLEEAVLQFARDPSVRVILAYMEGVRCGADLVCAAREVRRSGKPFAILKAGTTAAGARAALSHTASLAGEPRVTADIFDELGIIQARSVTHLIDIGRVLSHSPNGIGRRVTAISTSGGFAAICGDLIEQSDLQLANWDEHEVAELVLLMPRGSRHNPFDIGGGIEGLRQLLDILQVADRKPDSDATIFVAVLSPDAEADIAETLISAVTEQLIRKPLIVVGLGGTGIGGERLNSAGIPCFDDPSRAIAAMSSISYASSCQFAHSTHHGQSTEPGRRPNSGSVRRANEKQVLSTTESMALLASKGISVASSYIASSTNEAQDIAEEIGYPVVVKLDSSVMTHKSDHNAVRVGLTSGRELTEAAEDLLALAKASGPGRRGALVIQPQIRGTLELMLGMVADEAFGPVISVGIGGVMAEVFQDVKFALPDIGPGDVSQLVSRLKFRKLLRGYRGLPEVDPSVLTATIIGFASLVRDIGGRFDEIDVNPLILADEGSRLVAVDALFVY